MRRLIITPSAAIVAVLLATLLAGCSFNPIGESTFDCNRKENPSEYCRSFKALEKSTSGPLPESRFDKEFRMSDYDRATGIAPIEAKAQAASTGAVGAASLPLLPHQRTSAAGDTLEGMPLRKAPVVQRVWIKRFVDENDSLQDDMLVYREIRSGRWSGFDAPGLNAHLPGAYPHRAKGNVLAGGAEEPRQPPPNLAQPDSDTAGEAGSALPPAATQSGGLNASKAER